jgi:hypothetical protein
VDDRAWTGTLPDGTSDTPNCNDWTSASASDTGSGGLTFELDAEWTTEALGSCAQPRRLICFHIQSG